MIRFACLAPAMMSLALLSSSCTGGRDGGDGGSVNWESDAGDVESDAGDVESDAGDVEEALQFEHAWTEAELCAIDESSTSGCCAEGRVALPDVAASILDLRGLVSGSPGTCGDPTKQELPTDPAAYPLMVLLPEIATADAACTVACAGRIPETVFGVVLTLPEALVDDYRPMIVAPPPWRFVYDHNSLAGDACLGGYQEFGARACVRPNYGGAIGFATSATTTTGAALIALQPGTNGVPETCCPYLPTTP